jgi:Mrp family chromosome partitioning ATPase
MVARAIRDFLGSVMWGTLDYLMVESPDCDTAQIFTEIAHKLVTSFVGSEAK